LSNGDGPAATAELNFVIALAVHKNKVYLADLSTREFGGLSRSLAESQNPEQLIAQ
jgi:hypothetical protein